VDNIVRLIPMLGLASSMSKLVCDRLPVLPSSSFDSLAAAVVVSSSLLSMADVSRASTKSDTQLIVLFKNQHPTFI